MKKNKTIVLSIALIIAVVFSSSGLYLMADDSEKTNQDKYTYIKRISEIKNDKTKPKYMSLEEIEKTFINNSSSLELEKINEKTKRYTMINDREKLDKLEESIDKLEIDKNNSNSQLSTITTILNNDDMLPPGHPNKLTPLERQTYIENKAKLIAAINTMVENLDNMRKNYIMLDYKHYSNFLDLSYSKKSFENFTKIELQNLKSKLIDIVEKDKILNMKNDELEFMTDMYNVNKLSYELGFVDKMTLLESKNRLDEIEIEIKNMEGEIDNVFDELSMIIGVDYIYGIKLEKDFFDYKLKSTESSYYKEKYIENSFNIPLMKKQINLLRDTESELRDETNFETDADILSLNKKKAEINKNNIEDMVEMAARKMISGYKELEKEKDKLSIKRTFLLRKIALNDLKYSLGYISELDCKKTNFEYKQVENSIYLIEVKMIGIKTSLENLADGIIQK